MADEKGNRQPRHDSAWLAPFLQQYTGQRIFIVDVEGYVCLVPFVENDAVIFLKAVITSRKMARQYLGGDSE